MVKRPAMQADRKRAKLISVRLNEREWARLQKLAKERSISPSSYLREVALHDFPKDKAERASGRLKFVSNIAELQSQNLHLARIGTNLNQLARHANFYKGAADTNLLQNGIEIIRRDIAASFERKGDA